jgi:membrane protein YdbS with pleckstrin-like domain
MSRPLVFKKSPIVIVGSFIALQFATVGLYMLAASMAYYAQIWRSLPILRDINFSIAQGVFLFALEIGLVFYMFLSWYRQTIRLTSDQLIYDRGLFMRSHTVVPFSNIATVTFRQSLLGRLTHYGLVEIVDARGALLVRLDSMPEPQEFVQEITGRIQHRVGREVAKPSTLLAMPEHERLERKSTFRWDLKSNSINKALERAAIKTVAAFMNSQGGHLLLGVGDAGEVVGLEADYATLQRRDADGFQNHFNNILSSMVGPSLRAHVRLEPFTHNGKECMLVSVSPSDRPAYVRDQDREEFFIRTGNGSTSLRMSEAQAYISSRFSTKS